MDGSGPTGAITSRPSAVSLFRGRKGREVEGRRRRQRRPVAEAAATTSTPRDQSRPSIRHSFSGERGEVDLTGGDLFWRRPSPAQARLPKVDGKTGLRLHLRVISVEDAAFLPTKAFSDGPQGAKTSR